jgi:hypothetical protein
MIFDGGDEGLMFISCCAQIMGPTVFVCKWSAKSLYELKMGQCLSSVIGFKASRNIHLCCSLSFGIVSAKCLPNVGKTAYIRILEYASIENHSINLQSPLRCLA